MLYDSCTPARAERSPCGALLPWRARKRARTRAAVPRHCCPVDGSGTRLYPAHRHDYAVDNSPWPPDPALRPGPEFPARHERRFAPLTSPKCAGTSWRRIKRRNVTGFSRIPSPSLTRARPIRRSLDPTQLCRGCSRPCQPIHASAASKLHRRYSSSGEWRGLPPPAPISTA